MKYVSIDIETLGLNPQTCQVIEFGAVYDNGDKLERLLAFHAYVKHPVYSGEPYALAMHSEIFKRIDKEEEPYLYLGIDELADEFLRFIQLCGIDDKFTVAGKNYGMFDNGFLHQTVPGWGQIPIKHRVIDVGNLYLRHDDDAIPDTKTCMKRAGLEGEVAHTALEDAMTVVKLVRHKFNQNKLF